MSELSDESRALFRNARDDLAPSSADARRVERAIALAIAAGAAGAAITSASAAASAASTIGASAAAPAAAVTSAVGAAQISTSSGVALKWLSVLALTAGVGAGGAIGYSVLGGAAPASPPAEPVSSSPEAVEPAGEARTVAPTALAPEATAEASADPVAPVVDPSRASISSGKRPVALGSVADEARLLRDAHQALQSGNPSAALALLDAHARAHPSGAMSEERAAGRVFALCGAGRVVDARQAAARFLAKHPKSPLAKSVREACATGGASSGK